MHQWAYVWLVELLWMAFIVVSDTVLLSLA